MVDASPNLKDDRGPRSRQPDRSGAASPTAAAAGGLLGRFVPRAAGRGRPGSVAARQSLAGPALPPTSGALVARGPPRHRPDCPVPCAPPWRASATTGAVRRRSFRHRHGRPAGAVDVTSDAYYGGGGGGAAAGGHQRDLSVRWRAWTSTPCRCTADVVTTGTLHAGGRREGNGTCAGTGTASAGRGRRRLEQRQRWPGARSPRPGSAAVVGYRPRRRRRQGPARPAHCHRSDPDRRLPAERRRPRMGEDRLCAIARAPAAAPYTLIFRVAAADPRRAGPGGLLLSARRLVCAPPPTQPAERTCRRHTTALVDVAAGGWSRAARRLRPRTRRLLPELADPGTLAGTWRGSRCTWSAATTPRPRWPPYRPPRATARVRGPPGTLAAGRTEAAGARHLPRGSAGRQLRNRRGVGGGIRLLGNVAGSSSRSAGGRGADRSRRTCWWRPPRVVGGDLPVPVLDRHARFLCPHRHARAQGAATPAGSIPAAGRDVVAAGDRRLGGGHRGLPWAADEPRAPAGAGPGRREAPPSALLREELRGHDRAPAPPRGGRGSAGRGRREPPWAAPPSCRASRWAGGRPSARHRLAGVLAA